MNEDATKGDSYFPTIPPGDRGEIRKQLSSFFSKIKVRPSVLQFALKARRIPDDTKSTLLIAAKEYTLPSSHPTCDVISVGLGAFADFHNSSEPSSTYRDELAESALNPRELRLLYGIDDFYAIRIYRGLALIGQHDDDLMKLYDLRTVESNNPVLLNDIIEGFAAHGVPDEFTTKSLSVINSSRPKATDFEPDEFFLNLLLKVYARSIEVAAKTETTRTSNDQEPDHSDTNLAGSLLGRKEPFKSVQITETRRDSLDKIANRCRRVAELIHGNEAKSEILSIANALEAMAASPKGYEILFRVTLRAILKTIKPFSSTAGKIGKYVSEISAAIDQVDRELSEEAETSDAQRDE